MHVVRALLALVALASASHAWNVKSRVLDTSFLNDNEHALVRRKHHHHHGGARGGNGSGGGSDGSGGGNNSSAPVPQWQLTQPGTTGVNAMQFVIVSETQALVIDKAEHNPLKINNHSAWSALYDLNGHHARPVFLETNSFCAAGAFLSNGTLINLGGNPVADPDLQDTNGMQAVRLFHPPACLDNATTCSFLEYPTTVRLANPRWYPSVVKLDDGSLLIIGGSWGGGFSNNAALAVNSFEFFPPKAINGFNGTTIPSKFLRDTLNANLFPFAIVLPAGRVLIIANTKAMMYDWRGNYELRLPDLPNGVHVSYPMSGTAVLLPLTPANNYTPIVLICGGSTSSDQANENQLSAQDPASAQCASLEVSVDGIRKGWIVEQMPTARIMPNMVLLPTGQVLIVNGGKTGYAGYGNVKNEVGASNADNPVYQAVLYDATLPLGSRFSSAGIPASTIPRLYHSVATLAPSGAILIAGSNPNLDVSNLTYATEYRLEELHPPYMADGVERPAITSTPPPHVYYGHQYNFTVSLPYNTKNVSAIVVDYGFSTHAVHMGQRLVGLNVILQPDGQTLTITGPPGPTIFPPGPGFIYVIADGIPSTARQVTIGTGVGPVVNEGAIAK